ncbi:MAG: hypothetical protein AAF975_06900, partial [Spirochaetota bacterium]
GKHDPIALATEKFTQWVIEDDFPAGRPPWEQAGGVIMARNEEEVGLYEEMKLRMLNGSHSFLAYCGYLANKEYIYECMQDDTLRRACYRFICEEQLPGLRFYHDSKEIAPDLLGYAEELLKRYSNPNIHHRCYQIAMDGSLKIPQRWLDAYRVSRKKANHSSRFLSFALAAWLQYVRAQDLNGAPIVVQDPHASALRQLVTEAPAGQEASALLSFTPCFGDLATDPTLLRDVQQCYRSIQEKGLIQALADLLSIK